MKILIIGATHGDELLGIKVYERLLSQRSPLLEQIDFLVGNPRAYAQKTRYTETDLNRSYGVTGDSYEQQRAREIQQYMSDSRPDLVLDMHTTNCHQPPCVILSDLKGQAKKQFLRACHIPFILKVKSMNDIVTLGNNIIGYEVPNRLITPQLLDAIIDDIGRFINGTGGSETKQLFAMNGKIFKSDVSTSQAKTFVNFEQHELGFVPIMTGNNSYKRDTDYLGFKASLPEEIKV